jgi:DNA-binding response OmpR family regulator
MGEVVYVPQFRGRPSRAEHVSTAARILIVDGDPAALAAISQALQNEGHSTATAFDSSGALAVAERLGPFDLLIADVESTEGVDIADDMRRRDHTLQVLYVTKHREDLTDHARPLCDDGEIIEKPFSESALVDAVSSLLYWRTPRSAQ